MAETKETFKVKDFTDTVKGVTGIVKENYLNGVDLYFSLWTENLKVLDSQLEQWFGIQQEYIKAGKEVYEKLPKEFGVATKSDTADRFLAIQKDYAVTVKKVSDKFAKDTLNLARKNAEKAFSLVDDYLKLFRA